MGKINIDFIKEEAAKANWKLLSEEYKNLDSELRFQCAEGHQIFSTWKKVRDKFNCPMCQNNQFKNLNNNIIQLPKKRQGTKRILALDQATRISGYSVFDGNELIKYGTFETSLENEIERDNMLRQWLINAIENWKPDKIIIEGIQFQNSSGGQSIMGVTTFETLARLQGILMLTCFLHNVPYEIVNTQVWRKYCGIKGKSRTDKKKSAQCIVKDEYDITVSNDEADAILIGKYGAAHFILQTEIKNWE